MAAPLAARTGRPSTSAMGRAVRRTCSKRRWIRRTARLVRRCFRFLNAKSIGLTITLADITEEEFRVMELIEAERQEQLKGADGGAHGPR